MTGKSRKDPAPAVMSILLLSGIVLLSLVRYRRMPGLWTGNTVNLDFVFAGLYVLWVLAEAPVAGRDSNTQGKTTSDSATCGIYGLGQALTFLSALWFPSAWHGPGTAHFLGLSLFLLGVGYRLWAVRTLGEFYSHRVRTVTGHRIVDSGPYRFTRHPAYAGMILAHAGVVVYFLNGWTPGIFLLVLVPAVVFRIRVEERVLLGIEGYSEFAGSRKRLFPGIW